MRDVSFNSAEQRYILAGDYFLDILRSAHAMYVNKEMFNSLFESADEKPIDMEGRCSSQQMVV